MVLIDPLQQRRRHQERLLAIALNDSLGHHQMVLIKRPVQHDLPRQPPIQATLIAKGTLFPR